MSFTPSLVHPIAKLGPDLPLPRCWRTFRLEARSRGKEMRLDIWPVRIDAKLRKQEEKERQQLDEAKRAQAEADEEQQERDDDEEDDDEQKEQPTRKRKKAQKGRGGPITRVHPDNPIIPLDGPLPLLFRCGMTGHIQSFPSHTATHKHAHLSFLSSEPSDVAVCFVDQRQFGRWLVTSEWDRTRGPCPLTQYPFFRQHVLDSLDKSYMQKPLCEVMLNQKVMNGIGNYLRAEICHRADINPFATAHSVLSRLVGVQDRADQPDVLRLCHDVPLEVFTMGYRYGSLNNEEALRQQKEMDEADAKAEAKAQRDEDDEDEKEEGRGESVRVRLPPTKQSRKSFHQWLRCYEKHNLGMLSTVDGLGRAMWHSSRWRVAGKSKAGSRRPRKGKTISGVDREEDDSAAAQTETAEEETASQQKKKMKAKSKKAQPKKKAVRKADKKADEQQGTAASGGKRASSRKRTRSLDEADTTAAVPKKARRSVRGSAAAIDEAGDESTERQTTEPTDRRRSSRLSLQKGQKEGPTLLSDQTEEDETNSSATVAANKENIADSGEERVTTTKQKRAKKAVSTRGAGRGLRQRAA